MNILLANDHNLIKDGKKLIVEQLDSGFTIHEAESYQGVIDAMNNL